MHPFTDPQLTRDTQDLYPVRSSILKALNLVKPRLQGSLLDIGCGVMPYRELLLAKPSSITRYIGMDLGSHGIYKKVPPDIEWDGRTAPLEDASVENAMAIEVLEHCPEPMVVLREAHRVMCTGGTFFFTVPFLWPLHDVPYDEHRYTPFAMERMLKDAGFKDVIVTPHGGWNASLAQMIGLWVTRKPMTARRRSILKRLTFPVVRSLLRNDNIGPLAHGPMITGLWGTAVK
ncbi:MAG: methyltransferase domain-containing protein [Flavobacteriales bacterium]